MGKKVDINVLKQASNKLASTWAATSKGQAIYQGVNQRFSQVANHISFLEGLTVLDIGSNQGLHSCHLSSYCPQVYGVEVNEGAYKRSVKTKKWMLDNGYNVNNVSFYNKELCNFSVSEEVNGILAACVIYNMNNENIERFLQLLDQCKKVIFQTRPSSLKRIEGRSNYNICAIEDVKERLIEKGFKISGSYYEDTRWPVILAEK